MGVVSHAFQIQCWPELRKQHRHETDTMDASAQTRARVSADEHLHQFGRVRKEKIFLLLFTVTTLLCGALLRKTKQILGFEEA